MPKFIDFAEFDTNLFKLKVGRIEFTENDMKSLQKDPPLDDVVKAAYSSGYRVLYLFAPTQSASVPLPEKTLPGLQVDVKTTLLAKLSTFDKGRLATDAFTTSGIRIAKYKLTTVTEALRTLAITSGVYSRFKVDSGIPNSGFEGMFEAWATNSANRKLADEIFVAYDINNEKEGEEIGFITLKKKGTNVNIGLLAVSDKHRRRGIAKALMGRAALWSLEELGHIPDATMNVVTQGANAPAVAAYEAFGFKKDTVQEVYHMWLPEHMPASPPPADIIHPIPFCKQHFTGKEVVYATQVINSGLDSASNFTMMCGAKIRSILGEESDRVVMVPSGTAALEMAALLAELVAGDEVILPSFTFSSTANCFVLRGVVPVFIDVRADTLNIDETRIEAAITPKTKAICAVHYAGVACEMDTIMDIARRHNLYVIEDAAQGFMSTYKGRQLGTIGDFGCFSFHYTKNIICGEGGALSVNRNAKFASRSMVMWEKGTNRYDFMMGKIDKYHWIDLGSSYVPNELSCAVLYAQLEAAETINARRVDNYYAYKNQLQELVAQGKFRYGIVPDQTTTNAHIFFLVLPSVATKKYYESELKKRGISAFSHYVALHSAPAGVKYGRFVGDMSVTDTVQHTLLRLPVWYDMTDVQIQHVITSVHEIAANAPTA